MQNNIKHHIRFDVLTRILVVDPLLKVTVSVVILSLAEIKFLQRKIKTTPIPVPLRAKGRRLLRIV